MHKILELLNTPLLMESSALSGLLEGYRCQRALVPTRNAHRKIKLDSETIEIKASLNEGYPVTSGGIAVISIDGAMFRGYGAYGYCDQNDIIHAVMTAETDPNVNGIMMVLNTPGGSVSGTPQLGRAIQSAAATKPLHAYVDDLCASAGMWVASQASRVTAEPTSIVGSVGVITTLVDATKYFEGIGVKILNITTGKLKDVGDAARVMTPEDIDYMQGKIDALGQSFFEAVATGRGMRVESVRKMNAALYVGAAAVEAKLIDGLGTFSQAMKELGKATKNAAGNKRAKAIFDKFENSK